MCRIKSFIAVIVREVQNTRVEVRPISWIVGILLAILYVGLLVYSQSSEGELAGLYGVVTTSNDLPNYLAAESKLKVTHVDINQQEVEGRHDIFISPFHHPNVELLHAGNRAKAAGKTVANTLEATYRVLLEDAADRNASMVYHYFPLWVELHDIREYEYDNQSEVAGPEGSNEVERGFTLSPEQLRQRLSMRPAEQARNQNVASKIKDVVTKSTYDELTTPDQLLTTVPFKSVVFAAMLLAPLLLISTAFIHSFHEDARKGRPALLLSSPLSLRSLVIGKTIPYFIPSLIIAALLFAWLAPSASALFIASIAGAVILMFYFSINMLIALLARSYKELSFYKTVTGTGIIAYIFLPTLFISISEIAYISPLTTVTQVMLGEVVTLKLILMSTIPMLATSVVIFYAAAHLMSEEVLQESSIGKRLLGMMRGLIKSPYHLFFWGMLAFPMSMIVESIVLIMMTLPSSTFTSFTILIIVAALTEEALKNLGITGILDRHRKNTIKQKLLWSLACGVGFALAEKAVLTIMIPEIIAILQQIAIPLFIVPMLFHSFTVFIFSLQRKRSWLAAYIIAVIVHAAYNMIVHQVFV